MAKVRLKTPIVEIQGTLYEVIFKRSPQGKTIISNKPDMSHVKWSQAQKEQRLHFKAGVATVQAALREPKVRLKYERKAKRQKKRAWDLAMADYFAGKDLYRKR